MVHLSSNRLASTSRTGSQLGDRPQQDLRATLSVMVAEALAERQLSQFDAARICETDQPTLSKILAGRKQSASAEKLICWLMALGWDVEIRLKPSDEIGKATVLFDE